MSQRFIKNKEDFLCEKCGANVSGSGYTNHCPKCLWSKHVDVYPGDRGDPCGGLMEPTSLLKRGEDFIINHHCLSCGHEKTNKSSPDDEIGRFLTAMIE